ncbi:MAG: hypothetical protein ACM3OC_00375 [Deltaproteobacteria bacterium]
MAKKQRKSRSSGRKSAGSLPSGKWIKSPEQHEDHKGQSLVTRSHDVIMEWAKNRKAKPATIEGTEHGKRPGVLRLDFPDYGGQELRKIGWDYWFKSFDTRHLVFQFQEHMKNGKTSNFFKLNNPKRERE